MIVINDNLLVQVDKAPTTTASGLYIPEAAQNERIISGVVVDVGNGRILENGMRAMMQVDVGDTVWFPKFNSSQIEEDGNTYYVVAESQILAVK